MKKLNIYFTVHKCVIILIALILLVLSSCNMKRYCQDRYPPETITETETVEKTIYRDSIVYIELESDTIFQKDTVIEVDGLFQSKRLYAETEYCEGWTQVVNGNLLHEIAQKEAKIEKLLQTKEKIITKTVYKQVVKEVPADLSWWQQTMIRAGYVLLGLILVAIAGFVLRKNRII